MSKSLGRSIEIREAFYDKPHKNKSRQRWDWPSHLVEVGTCEAVLYSSDKWQSDGKMIDYKHVAEGPQQLLLREDLTFSGDEEEFYGPRVSMRGEWPDSFAVLAKALGIQARLYKDHDGKQRGSYVDLKFPPSKLGAGTFQGGGNFVFVFDSSGPLAVVVGSKLDILKDGIVG